MTNYQLNTGHDLSADCLREKTPDGNTNRNLLAQISESSIDLYFLAREFARGNLKLEEFPNEHWI